MKLRIAPEKNTPAPADAPVDLSGLRALNANVSLRAGSFVFRQYRIADARIEARLDKGMLKVPVLQAKAWGGALDANALADARASRIAVKAVATGVNVNALLKDVADLSFNSITVDGDTSTNDSFLLIATGEAGNPTIADAASPDYAVFRAAVLDLAIWLAQAIVRDGEGATKFMTLQIEGGRDRGECRKVGYAIGHSPLVKTAFFASDPNLGRILAAIGYAGIDDLDVAGIKVWLGSNGEEVLVAEKGGRAAGYNEEAGARIMQAAEITIRVNLGRGQAGATMWTCDFSYDYVKINADYRS